MIENFMMLLLPIFNSPNHTGKKRNNLFLYIFTIFMFLILFITSNTFDLNKFIYIFLVITFLIVITTFELTRSNLFHKIFKVYKEIDNLISKKSNNSQINEIYNLIMNRFSDFSNVKIEQISCFKKDKNQLNLINSSSFIYEFKLDLTLLNKERKNFNNIPIEINEKKYLSVITISAGEYYFLCLVPYNELKISMYKKFYLYELSRLLFEKVTKIIEQENILAKEKTRHTERLSNKQHYVLEVMNSTHFFSNKLSTIKNFIQSSEDYDNNKFKTIDDKKIKEIIRDERKKAKSSLENISNKMNKLLDKGANPFIPTTTRNLKYKYIFMLIKRLWIQEFNESNIIFINTCDENFNRKVESNDEIIEFIFIDLLTNMKKYSNGYQSIEFDFNKPLTITIKNNIKNYNDQKIILLKTIENFNNNERLEINRRNNFGLSHIKDLSLQLNIDVGLSLNEDKKYYITKLVFQGEEK
ncbi:hypothetical protein [Malaciobacter marinus]|uniref:hypothetical protein n=1 Tax=Malaciobacter marinus TaxID=505249 RepID=UPI001056DDDB|nr:hypothetical protein [Malaciobacter marinus]